MTAKAMAYYEANIKPHIVPVVTSFVLSYNSSDKLVDSHLELLDGASSDELRELGRLYKPLNLAVYRIYGALTGLIADATPHDFGRVAGVVAYEVTVEVAGAAATAGAANTARWLVMSGRVAAFLKNAKWLEKILTVERAAKLIGMFEDGGDIYKFLQKLESVEDAVPDEIVDDAVEGGKLAEKIDDTPIEEMIDELIDVDRNLPILNQEFCFAAGTPVLTPCGSRPIECIRPGDTVVSRAENDPLGPTRFRLVEKVFELQAPLVNLHIGGRIVATTAAHPFYVSGKGWTATKDVEVGDRIVTVEGISPPVERVDDADTFATVYNLRVNEDHTFFVGGDDWGFALWVHNDYEAVYDKTIHSFRILKDGKPIADKTFEGFNQANALKRAKLLNAAKEYSDFIQKTDFTKPVKLTDNILAYLHKDLKHLGELGRGSPLPKNGSFYIGKGLKKQVFETDNLGRLSKTTFTLDEVVDGLPRTHGHMQTAVGHLGKSGDVGFHLKGHNFVSDGRFPNVIPFDGFINSASGAYGQLESIWKQALKADKKLRITVEVSLIYDPRDPLRPIGLDVLTIVKGRPKLIQIDALSDTLDAAAITDLKNLLGI